MKTRIFIALLTLFLYSIQSLATTSVLATHHISARHKQLLLVTTNDWNSQTGTIQRYQRTTSSKTWQRVGDPIPIVLGKHGMAWGSDLGLAEQVKKEGDLRTPAGIFNIQTIFGFAATADSRMKLPYLSLSNNAICVDDQQSKYYNQIIDSGKVPSVDWNSGEAMHSIPQYELGAVIEYNTKPPIPGRGSCIFMHIWRDAHTGTSGCVAMQKENLQRVLTWLDPKKQPVIAIFPQENV